MIWEAEIIVDSETILWRVQSSDKHSPDEGYFVMNERLLGYDIDLAKCAVRGPSQEM